MPTAANTFQQAFSQAGLPFNQAIGQQAAQFAAALAQAQQATQLLPQQINPAIQFPGRQVHMADRTEKILLQWQSHWHIWRIESSLMYSFASQ